ncbi:hypothetical protein [Hymenobacter rigui]|uniref:Uncharacterized protein n=1 Tax=Hymenobacter rigui TaxID=334424 RepID=A0A428KF70_9BACT|nr:hypothetical protein [Hymenobacter rigui]RSK45066.1 hypothetical protein EI291_19710 [Hymenobacter rigui]
MKQLLIRLGLIQYLSFRLPISAEAFYPILRHQVDIGSTQGFAMFFDILSSGSNDYVGEVRPGTFSIRRRKRFFDMSMNLATATGTYATQENGLMVTAEINGFSGVMIPFLIFALLIYSVGIGSVIFADGIPFFVLFFLLIHAAFMLGIPYFIMKRGTKRMAYELERDFYYLAGQLQNR